MNSSVTRVNLPGTRLHEDSPIDREEFIRLIIQSLRDVGYIESAATLEAESGYRLESNRASQFRQYVLNAEWNYAENSLSSLGLEDESDLRTAKFLISQQKYLELLESQSVNAALTVLRGELAPLSTDTDQLHSLSTLMMCSDVEDLRMRAKWDGASGSSRSKLLANLQQFVPPSVMIPERRFESLIEEAFAHQRTQCLYHNAPYGPEAFSLYSDHHCSRELFPWLTTNILKHHGDEVWNVKWSNDGQYLASASKDKSAIIWHIGPELSPNERECSLVRIFPDHQYDVGCVSWSPDDSMLLTNTDSIIKIWNSRTGVLIRELIKHNETVSAIEWLPDNSGLLSGGMDRKICYWDTKSKEPVIWLTTPIRVTDLAIAPDLSRVVVIGLEHLPASASSKSSSAPHENQSASGSSATQAQSMRNVKENRLVIYDYASRTLEASIRLDGELTSVKISQDSQYALVNHAPDEVQLWDLEAARMVRKFTGQSQGRHVIRSCFGGADGNFIVSGSEDGNVYVWHRDTGALLEVLGGHGVGSVNDVSWNPRNERMFASCSDDQTVRIWESPVARVRSEDKGHSQTLEQNGKGKGKVRERPPWYDPSMMLDGKSSLRGNGSTGFTEAE